jgi:hypothetical protein
LIEVRWPTTQKVERFTNIPANQFLTIKEGAGIIKRDKPNPPPSPDASQQEIWIWS